MERGDEAALDAVLVVEDLHERRQAIVDSWPEDVDDKSALNDWGYRPEYDLDRTMREYLVPNIRERYGRD